MNLPVALPDRVAAVLSRHVRPGQRLVVGLSGGLDSMALLEVLHRLAPAHGYTLAACHVHHGLSPNADDWVAFCRAQCAARGVPLRVERVAVVRASGLGLEAAARDARHAVFAAQPAHWLVLAHHRGDQAETVLHRLLRGGGARGLAAMAEVRAMPPTQGHATAPRLLRPLLAVPRADIAAWAAAQGLAWIEDESNADGRYTRNFLRRDVLPRMAERFPDAEATLARAARHFGEVDAMLGGLAELDLAATRHDSAWGEAYRVSDLAARGTPRAINALRHALERLGATPARAELEEVWRQLAQAGPEASIHALFQGAELYGWRGLAWPGRRPSATPPAHQPWPRAGGAPALRVAWGDGVVTLTPATGQGIRHDLFARDDVQLRRRHGGERLRLHPRQPGRTLKNLFQEHAIPPWLRPHLPLLATAETLVWVPGVGVDCAFRAASGEPGWVPAYAVASGADGSSA